MLRCQPPGAPRRDFLGVLLAVTLLGVLPTTVPGAPATAAKRLEYQDARLRLRFMPRSPQQIRAFYEARGFPPAALAELAATCFITVGIRNRSRQVLWHDLKDWRFTRKGKPLARLLRSHWQRRWEELGIRAGLRATFRWTLLPETLDFQPDEGEGGNIILPRGDGPIRIEAVFHTGPHGTGETLRIETGDIPCAVD